MCMMMMGLLGGVMSGIGAMQAANAQAAAAKAQGQQYKMEGRYALAKSSFDRDMAIERGKVMGGQAVTGYSAAGVDVASGTPSDKITFGIYEPAVLEGNLAKMEGKHRANQAFYAAKIKNMEAASAKQAGIIGMMTPIIGAFGQMGGGFR
jgi:multidrug efflux pump subunit AcrA (membrane-fusion protein)